MTVTRTAIKQFAENLLQTATWQIEAFDEKVKKNGLAYALEWSSDLHIDAQRKAFAELILAHITKEEAKPEAVVAWVAGEVRRKARYPHRSTSVMANEAAIANLSVMAEFLERFDPIR